MRKVWFFGLIWSLAFAVFEISVLTTGTPNEKLHTIFLIVQVSGVIFFSRMLFVIRSKRGNVKDYIETEEE